MFFEIEPSGDRDTESPPAKSKMAAMGRQTGRWCLKRCLLGDKKEKEIISDIVASNVIANQPP